jgi:hypothetical protein
MYKSPFGTDENYEFELPGEAEGEAEQESDLEAELATELLEISTEAELDRFLGKLASSVMRGASTFIKSPIGQALGGVLKNVAKTALPAVGGALGSLVLPGAGTAIGAKLGSMAGGLLEAGEAEMMAEAEAEFEAAQRYVRFARSAWRNAAGAPRNLPPRAVVRAASISAARTHAPSLLRGDLMALRRQRRGPGRRPGYASARSSYAPYPYPPWSARPEWAAEPDRQDSWPGGADAGYDAGYDEPDPTDESGYEMAAEGPGGVPPSGANEGRWVRRRGHIVLLGV